MLIKKIVGGYCISELVNGYLMTRRYYIYTKKEAVSLFRSEVRQMK